MVTDWTRRARQARRRCGSSAARGVPAGAVLDTMELMNEPSFCRAGHIADRGTSDRPVQNAVLGPCASTGPSAKTPAGPRLLGQHNAQVFRDWLGMSAGDVDGLKKEGVI